MTPPLISMPSRFASSRSRSAAVIWSIGNSEVSTACTPFAADHARHVVSGIAERLCIPLIVMRVHG